MIVEELVIITEKHGEIKKRSRKQTEKNFTWLGNSSGKYA